MSNVYFTKSPDKVAELFDQADLGKVIAAGDRVALKIHFGEIGNTAYIKPERVKAVIEKVKSLGGKPFLTDANTLYHGTRSDNKSHLRTAYEHGYTLGNTRAEVIIADDPANIRGQELHVNYKHFKKLYVAARALEADCMLAVSHFKGHDTTGFGGALKNIGMGLGSRLGKLKMHQSCQGCPEIKTCRKNQTLESCWVGSPESVQERMVEYAAGIVEHFKRKVAYINFITDVSPNCDCYPYNSPPIIPDVGVLASLDPVAIDQASADLVNNAGGRDMFRELYPKVDWQVQLKHAEEIGLGSRAYELVVE